ncbi:MAG: hypothetical protein JO202_16145 [Ktedonobacteraceae bacterium]|nr:hypothetical protein [Ktedonobacteraceae bacterium]
MDERQGTAQRHRLVLGSHVSQGGQRRSCQMTRILLHSLLAIALAARFENPPVLHYTHGLRVDLPIGQDQAIALALVCDCDGDRVHREVLPIPLAGL